ncbi:MAG: hypothetical protein HC869_17635, partial [Rhodospirillales bacterium]|nr:hypothetical protein [Rhodospirillales bacterium]
MPPEAPEARIRIGCSFARSTNIDDPAKPAAAQTYTARSVLVADDNRKTYEDKKNTAAMLAMTGIAGKQEEPAGKQEGRRDSRECYYCGKIGHIKRDCRIRLKKEGQRDHQQRHDEDTAVMMMLQAQCNVQAANIKTQDNKLLFDTGATHHMVRNRGYFKTMQKAKIQAVTCGGGEKHKVQGSGMVTVEAAQGRVILTEVLYVPTLTTNVLSGLTALQKGFTWLGKGQRTQLLKDDVVKLTARLDQNNMMMIEGSLKTAVTEGRCMVLTDATLWHARLGHAADAVLAKMLDNKGKKLIDHGHPHISKDCDICLRAKQHRVSFTANDQRASRVMELVYADLMDFGDDIRSYGGGRYVLVVLDDHSRYSAVQILCTKGEAAQATLQVLRYWKNQTGQKLKEFRTDEGAEFESVLAVELKNGVSFTNRPPDTPRSRMAGVRESIGRSLRRCGLYC